MYVCVVVTFNLSQRTKGVTQCLLLMIIHDFYMSSSNVKFFFSVLQQDFSRPTSKDESLKFFAADVTLEAAALSLKIGFSKAELAATAAGAAVVDEAVDLLRI